MRKILILVILGLNLNTNAQDTSVEKTIFGIQTGFTGLWLNSENKLSNNLALKAEIGVEHDFTVGDHYNGAGFILQPVLTIEPKYYYNLEKRKSEGKKTSNNNGNYLSIKTSFHPDWFVINFDRNITKTADLAIVPTWGFRRQIGNNFNYETGVGLGCRIVYLKANYITASYQNTDDFSKNKNQYIPYLHLRIGYNL